MRKLSVLVIHNRYQQPGGEDAVVQAETGMLLSQAGHRVIPFTRDNSVIRPNQPVGKKLALAAGAIWNQQTCTEITAA